MQSVFMVFNQNYIRLGLLVKLRAACSFQVPIYRSVVYVYTVHTCTLAILTKIFKRKKTLTELYHHMSRRLNKELNKRLKCLQGCFNFQEKL